MFTSHILARPSLMYRRAYKLNKLLRVVPPGTSTACVGRAFGHRHFGTLISLSAAQYVWVCRYQMLP